MLMFVQIDEKNWVSINHIVAVRYCPAEPEKNENRGYGVRLYPAEPEKLNITTDNSGLITVVGEYIHPILDMLKSPPVGLQLALREDAAMTPKDRWEYLSQLLQE